MENGEKKPRFEKKAESVEKKPEGTFFYPHRERRHNVVIVRNTMTFKTLVMLAKTMLKNQFDTVELHAIDDQSYLTITLVAQCLMKYKYVTLSRLKTKTVQIYEEEEKSDPYAKLQPRLIAHLTKTKEFDTIYEDFEGGFKKMLEEHKDDIDSSELEGAKE